MKKVIRIIHFLQKQMMNYPVLEVLSVQLQMLQ